MLHLYELNSTVIAKTYMAPQQGQETITPGMKGVVIDRDEVTKRHQVRFENGREVWATSDQIKPEPQAVRA